MKTSNTILLIVCCCMLVLTNCGTTTNTTTVTPDPVKETPQPTLSAQDKEDIKKELKDELKNEIKKELELEQQTQKPPKSDVSISPVNEPKKPSKPAKPETMDVSTAENIIVGAWKWVETKKSIRGVGNAVNTPASMGFEKTAVFKKNGICEILLNNIPAGTYNYKISDGGGQLFINFSSTDNNTQHMENGPLLLEDNKFEVLGTYNDRGANIKFERM